MQNLIIQFKKYGLRAKIQTGDGFAKGQFSVGLAGGQLLGLVEDSAREAGCLIKGRVDLAAILHEEWPDDACIDNGRAVGADGQEAPDEEDHLGEPVKREPRKDDVRKELDR